jgi:hypothetical protein
MYVSARLEEADVGRRGGRRGSQGRAQGRVRDRVRGGGSGRGGGGSRRGGGESAGRKRGGFDVGAVQDLAGRLADRSGGGSSGGGSGFSGGGSGLAGAAAGLASGGLAGRFLGGGSEGSDEDFRNEVADQFALIEERMQALEDQMQELRGTPEDAETPAGPEDGATSDEPAP